MGPGDSAARIARAVARGDASCEEVARAALARAAAGNGPLNALLHLCPERALEEARALDGRRARGEALGPLAGVPLVAKDNLCTRGLPTTCASRMLEGYRPPYDATAVARAREAGAVLIGKANLDEFAMGSSTEHSAFGPCRNPLDPGRVPGGSSGGSAAAVAAGFAPLALGSDTGGSVRQPAAFCGLAGLRPTYGRVSRWGLVAFASSLDQVGPLALDVSDAWALYAALCGVDPRDPTTLDLPAEAPAPPEPEVRGLRVGLVRQHLGEGVEAGVRAAVEEAAQAMRAGGAEVREVSLPHDAYGVAAYYVLAPAEASSNLARFDGVRYGLREARPTLVGQYTATRDAGFGEEVKRRILAGTFVLSSGYYDAFYAKALSARAALRADFAEAFCSVDLLLDPTAPTAAFPLGEKDRDPLAMYLSDAFTIPAALAGLPALSVPRFPAGGGLPAGVQLTGPALSERRLCAAGRFLEEAFGGAP